MRKAILPVVALVILVIGFFVGSSTGITFVAISSFCLWTPASIWLGWSWAKSGVKIAVVADVKPSPNTKPKSEKELVKRAIARVQEDMG